MVTQSASTWLVAGMGVTEGHELPASVTVTGSTALVGPVTVTGLGGGRKSCQPLAGQ